MKEAMGLKLRGKLLLIISATLFLFSASVCSIIFYTLKANQGKEIETIRHEELTRTKETLKNYVDIAFETVNTNYKKALETGSSVSEAMEKAKQEIKAMRFSKGVGYFWINDTGKPYPKMVMHPTVPVLDGKELNNPKYNCALGIKKNLFQAAVEICQKDGEGFVDYLWPKPTEGGLTKEQPKLSFVKLHKDLGWIIGTGVYIDSIESIVARKTAQSDTAIKKLLYEIGFAILLIFIGAALIINLFTSKIIAAPLQKAVDAAEAIAAGDLSTTIDIKSSDEIGQLGKSMGIMIENLKRNREELETRITNMDEIITSVTRAANQVANGSTQISDSSQSLSQGATEQASSLEQITSSMTEMASQTRTNAENATQANQLVEQAREAAGKGDKDMQRMIEAMAEINDSSQSISKIIKVIDEIAFQTNLLALNAAVEAARAGKHGKGFAVVAEEVRNLAARSAKAAKETAELIEGSAEKTENGTEIANQTASGLKEIFTGVTKVADIVAEIAAASNEQAQGISQVNLGLNQIDQVTQQNTANAEQSAAAAEELSSQAKEMRDTLDRFSKISSQA